MVEINIRRDPEGFEESGTAARAQLYKYAQLFK
jgi:hypothetical protein